MGGGPEQNQGLSHVSASGLVIPVSPDHPSLPPQPGMEKQSPLGMKKPLELVKKTHQNIGAQNPQHLQGLPIRPQLSGFQLPESPNFQDSISSQ